MKKVFLFLFVSLFVVALMACGNEETPDINTELPEIIEVELNVAETGEVNEAIRLSSTVSQGNEAVADANEVVFEVWEEGKKDESEMIESNNKGDGTYEAEKTFEHDGLFHIQVHVTARGMHVMPTSTITIGDGGEYDHDHEHGDHADGFSMHFMKPEDVEVDQDIELIVHIQEDNQPMENARVRYEIRQTESGQTDWLDAEELLAGEYKAVHRFTEKASYFIQIHVENDDGLHEHQDYEIEVK